MRVTEQKWMNRAVAGMGLSLLLASASLAQNPSNSKLDNTSRDKTAHPMNQGVPYQGDQAFLQQAMEANQAEIIISRMALEKAASAEVKTFAQHMVDAHTSALTELKTIRMENALASDSQTGNANRSHQASRANQASTGGGRETGDRDRTRRPAASGNTAVDNRTDTTGSDSGYGASASPSTGSRIGQTDYKGDPSPNSTSKAYKEFGQLTEAHQVAINQLSGLSGAEFDKFFIATQIKLHQESQAMVEQGAAQAKSAKLKQFSQKMRPEIKKHLQEATRLQVGMETDPAKAGNH